MIACRSNPQQALGFHLFLFEFWGSMPEQVSQSVHAGASSTRIKPTDATDKLQYTDVNATPASLS